MLSFLLTFFSLSVWSSHAQRRNPIPAVLHIKSVSRPFLAEVALYGQSIPASADDALVVDVVDARSYGCKPWRVPADTEIPDRQWFAIVQRGNCTFLDKSLRAGEAGASGVFIVSYDNHLVAITAKQSRLDAHQGGMSIIPTLMISKDCYESMIKVDNPEILIWEYSTGGFDPSMVFVAAIAILVVVGGAFYSSDFERAKYHGTTRAFREQAEVQEVTSSMAWSFIAVASIGLIVLFYFMNELIYIVIFAFLVGGVHGMMSVGTHLVEYCAPSTHHEFMQVYFEFRKSEVIAGAPSFLLGVVWIAFRFSSWAWILQDVMCACLLLMLQRVVKLPSLRIAAILLVTAFFYDIFWVFLSPLFFTKSVMVDVARGGESGEVLPMLISIPRISDPFHTPMMLGLGDMALPGLLVSYLMRFDYMSRVDTWKDGYFLYAAVGYGVGLVLTYISLMIMQHGQPALLFLVPCTLGVIVYLANTRNRLTPLWNGKPSRDVLIGDIIGLSDDDDDEDTSETTSLLSKAQKAESKPIVEVNDKQEEEVTVAEPSV